MARPRLDRSFRRARRDAEYAAFDAERKFAVPNVSIADPRSCQCGEVLKGVIKPHQCKVFGTACTPETPLGSLMVSSEGACAAYHSFGRRMEKVRRDFASMSLRGAQRRSNPGRRGARTARAPLRPGLLRRCAPRNDGKTAACHDGKTAACHDGKTAARHDGKTAARHDGKTAPRHDGKTAPRHGGKAAPRNDGKAAPRHGRRAVPPRGGGMRAVTARVRDTHINLSHGGGGRAMRALIDDVFAARSAAAATLEDSASIAAGRSPPPRRPPCLHHRQLCRRSAVLSRRRHRRAGGRRHGERPRGQRRPPAVAVLRHGAGGRPAAGHAAPRCRQHARDGGPRRRRDRHRRYQSRGARRRRQAVHQHRGHRRDPGRHRDLGRPTRARATRSSSAARWASTAWRS